VFGDEPNIVVPGEQLTELFHLTTSFFIGVN
jgi:hypothetical protein